MKRIATLFCFTFYFIGITYSQYSSVVTGTFQGFSSLRKVSISFAEPTIRQEDEKNFEIKLINNQFQASAFLNNPAVVGYLTWEDSKRKYSKEILLDTGYNRISIGINKGIVHIIHNFSKTDSLRVLFKSLNGLPISNQLQQKMHLISNNLNNFSSLLELVKISRYAHRLSADSIERVLKRMSSALQMTPLGVELNIEMINRKKTYLNNEFPSLILQNLKGELVDIKTLPKRYYLIAFGASWCGPCKERIPKLKEISNLYPESKFNIIDINLDTNKVKWKKMIVDYDLKKWQHFSDTANMSHSYIVKGLSISLIPQYILVDQDWIILYNSMQEEDFDFTRLITLIENLSASIRRS